MGSLPTRKRNARRRITLRGLLRWLLMLRGSPRAIGAGVALGVLVAFSPTIGFQMVIAAFLATLLNANRPAALISVWITNPLTIPPLFAFTYWVGSFLHAGPPVSRVYEVMAASVETLARYEVWEMYRQLQAFAAVGRDILVPLLIGGLIVGALVGAIAYLLTVAVITRYRARPRRARKRASRA